MGESQWWNITTPYLIGSATRCRSTQNDPYRAQSPGFGKCDAVTSLINRNPGSVSEWKDRMNMPDHALRAEMQASPRHRGLREYWSHPANLPPSFGATPLSMSSAMNARDVRMRSQRPSQPGCWYQRLVQATVLVRKQRAE